MADKEEPDDWWRAVRPVTSACGAHGSRPAGVHIHTNALFLYARTRIQLVMWPSYPEASHSAPLLWAGHGKCGPPGDVTTRSHATTVRLLLLLLL
mgnify:CR=1 FL=1